MKEAVPEPSVPATSVLASPAFLFFFSAQATTAFMDEGFAKDDVGGFEVASLSNALFEPALEPSALAFPFPFSFAGNSEPTFKHTVHDGWGAEVPHMPRRSLPSPQNND